ncbi:cytochrome c oxidase assembly protein [Granulicella sp. WH15]|uniref:cytochrome c oxidase assembly protein n=1 Tax=Granulicella sp. WH15 TaxID=2602070 RepID=UPI0013677F1B|nr:cytochrome c oxidase assembly protein [Granulicella sp. WH15]QHN03646.1 cytochrome c oxidase assembly protein [Granulicella sp. WH15]
MSSEVQNILQEWSPPIFLSSTLLLCAAVYIRGWALIRKTRLTLFPAWRLGSFLLGLDIIWFAVGSPLDGFADAMLSAHMVEHLLLMSFVPPLLLLGNPQVPMLRGMHGKVTRWVLAPVLRSRFLRHLGHFLTKPIVAWLGMNLMFLIWHIPTAYDFALEHEGWHIFEHVCFLATSILFWWPLIRPWPTDAHYPGWHMLPYLVGADIVNTALSAFLAFCDRPVYSYYLEQPNPFHLSPLGDQMAGAVVMWVVGSLAFLVPAVFVTIRLLQQNKTSKLAFS